MATSDQESSDTSKPAEKRSGVSARLVILVVIVIAAFFYIRALTQPESDPPTTALAPHPEPEATRSAPEASVQSPDLAQAPANTPTAPAASPPVPGQFRTVKPLADEPRGEVPSRPEKTALAAESPIAAAPKPLPADQMLLLLDVFAPELIRKTDN